MNGLRSPRTLFSGGLLLGMLLVLGPVLQSAAGPCSRSAAAPVSQQSQRAASSSDAVQWTCADPSRAAVMQAVSPERSDLLLSTGFASSSTNVGAPTRTVAAQQGRTPPSPLISPVLEALRLVVLRI